LLQTGGMSAPLPRVADSADAAAWIADIEPGGHTTTGIVPSAFEAYVRIRNEEDDEGVLGAARLAVLVDLLRTQTRTPERCTFAVWDGYGRPVALTRAPPRDSRRRRPLRRPRPAPRPPLPRLDWPARLRGYYLFAGPIEAAAFFDEYGALGRLDVGIGWGGPNLWWPEDRSWCVATEIDLPWSYVGGTAQVASAVLGEPRLEPAPSSADEPIT
jgi:hypothetical protein